MTLKVFIDPGHGGADPGAVHGSLQEKVLTLKIANKVTQILQGYDVLVKQSRTGDQTVSLKQRTDMANQFGADLYVSIHINAGGGDGYEDFIHDKLTAGSKTAKMRQVFHQEVVNVLSKYGIRNRGQKKANYHVIRESKMPAILTEVLFIDTASNRSLLTNSTFINDIAEGHARGIIRSLGLTMKAPTTPTKPVSLPKQPDPKALYRVIADSKQVGAYGETKNVLNAVEKSINSNAQTITVQKV